MKKGYILIALLVSLVCLSYFSSSDKQDFYGTYIFEEVSYLSLLSSSTVDYINERMAGTKYTIEEDLFKIDSVDKIVEISTPNYVREEIPNGLGLLSDVSPFIGNEVEYQYTIYEKDGKKLTGDCMFLQMIYGLLHM